MAVDWRKTKSSMLKAMAHIYTTGLFTDVTLKVGSGKKEFKVHKVILMSRSEVFAAYFERWNGKISDDDAADVLDIQPDASTSGKSFEYFLKYLYTDKLDKKATVQEVLDVLELGHLYQVGGLILQCSELLETIITPENCGDIYQKVKLYADDEPEGKRLSQWVLEFLIRNIKEFSACDQFLVLDVHTLTQLLNSDGLEIEESELFTAIIRWSKHDGQDIQGSSGDGVEPDCRPKSSRKEELESLIPLIRFPLMESEVFTDTVVPTKLLSDSVVIKMFLYFQRGVKDGLEFSFEPRSGNARLKMLKCYEVDGPWADSDSQIYQLDLCPEIRLRSEKPIMLRGVRFYTPVPSIDPTSLSIDIEYQFTCTVSIETIVSLHTMVKMSGTVAPTTQGHFDVLLSKPFLLETDRFYWINSSVTPTERIFNKTGLDSHICEARLVALRRTKCSKCFENEFENVYESTENSKLLPGDLIIQTFHKEKVILGR